MSALYFNYVDYSLLLVLMGTTLVGFNAGIWGSFIFLRRESLLGDTLSHAIVPGMIAGFILAGNKNLFFLVIGAILFGWLSIWVHTFIQKKTPIQRETSIGIVLSTSLGIGVFLLTLAQNLAIPGKQGLLEYFFGNAASLLLKDLVMISIFFIVTLIFVLSMWKPFLLLTYDPLFLHSLGWNRKIWNTIFITLLIFSIIISIQIVGVLMVSIIFIAPAVAARRWTNHFPTMIGLSAFLGGATCFLGTLISNQLGIPTGAAIVLVAAGQTIISLFKKKPCSP